MASISNTPPLAVPIHDKIEERFRQLEAKWMAEVGHLSSHQAIVGHPSFREIVGMGEAVVPFMLRDLAAGPRLWVWALPEITGDDPVPAKDGGRIAKMSEAWVRWGRQRGYQ